MSNTIYSIGGGGGAGSGISNNSTAGSSSSLGGGCGGQNSQLTYGSITIPSVGSAGQIFSYNGGFTNQYHTYYSPSTLVSNVKFYDSGIKFTYNDRSYDKNLTIVDHEDNKLGTLSFSEMVKYMKQLELINEDEALKEMWDELQFALRLRGNHDYEKEDLRGNGYTSK